MSCAVGPNQAEGVLEGPLGCSNLSHQVRSGVAAQGEPIPLLLDAPSSNLGHGHREATGITMCTEHLGRSQGTES